VGQQHSLPVSLGTVASAFLEWVETAYQSEQQPTCGQGQQAGDLPGEVLNEKSDLLGR
jgi:hypothetical protein